jgi:hypothetical protein
LVFAKNDRIFEWKSSNSPHQFSNRNSRKYP